MNPNYHQTRIPYDIKRTVLWETLVNSYFQKLVHPNDTVIEIGAGYCDFINNIKASRKIAIDIWSELPDYANKDVECIVGDVEEVARLEDESLDFVFASNIFEHIEAKKLTTFIEVLRKKIKVGGSICILQPNYKLAFKEYFDDYTHVSIWTDQSLADFLASHKFNVKYVKAGFLPLSIKSKLPVIPLMIKIYLALPFKPLAKQMLIIASRK
jgi:ubiquinone/menaquinone biosynthesis C-methylase UbiE